MKTCGKQYTVAFFAALSVACVFFAAGFLQTAVSASPAGVADFSPHILISPLLRSGSFVEDTTFEVPIILDTGDQNVFEIEVRINFDKDKMAIMQQSNGISIIGKWTEAPQYDNAKGTASYIGTIEGGIKTQSGVIGVLTFKALRQGKAILAISDRSSVILNDGIETKANLSTERGEYIIIRKESHGANIFSVTHPDQNNWYNNNSPTISWDSDPDSEGFNFVLDNKPSTIPESIVKTKDNAVSFAKLADGLWYFHLKEKKNGVWGAISHFLIKIDTVPPAPFVPTINSLAASPALFNRIPVSFFTTDNLSGVDHYEVGMIDKNQPTTVSPSFMQTESPFLVPSKDGAQGQVIVRAVDKAGNARDATIQLESLNAFTSFIRGNYDRLTLIFILMILEGLILYYFFKHHIVKHLHQMFRVIKQEEEIEEMMEEKENIDENLYKTIIARENVLDKVKEITDLPR
jgi:hypothetical protein